MMNLCVVRFDFGLNCGKNSIKCGLHQRNFGKSVQNTLFPRALGCLPVCFMVFPVCLIAPFSHCIKQLPGAEKGVAHGCVPPLQGKTGCGGNEGLHLPPAGGAEGEHRDKIAMHRPLRLLGLRGGLPCTGAYACRGRVKCSMRLPARADATVPHRMPSLASLSMAAPSAPRWEG